MERAVIRCGGKQYHIAEGDVVQVPKMPGEKGDSVELNDVLMLSDGEGRNVVFGHPLVSGAKVRAKILRQDRSRKILVFTFKRRKGFEKRRGHRQDFTEVRIEKIEHSA